MDIGFETIGNATIIGYDHGPILVTDPWITGAPYFGSWAMSHEIPEEQLKAIKNAKYVWISHGHPDHLSQDSLNLLNGKTLLLPDHQGDRILQSMTERGYDVHLLPDKKWIKLSDHLRIMCLGDYNQDATLLIDINGRLIININDGMAYGWRAFIRRMAKKYPVSFILRLYGGEADMRNYFDEQGNRIPLTPKDQAPPLGKKISQATADIGATHFIPFSSFHRLQRADSIWLQPYVAEAEDYARGWDDSKSKLLPAFVRYDCQTDQWEAINPAKQEGPIVQPEEFGDNWSDTLSQEDVAKAKKYFQTIHHLSGFLDYINLRVGGQDNVIPLAKNKFNRGITFEAPRHSLMTCIEYEVFDDILIGNFMKTTLHGQWDSYSLYPDFTPYVAKYADNGRARTPDELRAYFASYRKRLGPRVVMDHFEETIEEHSKNIMRRYLTPESWLYQSAKRVYKVFK